MKRSFTQLFFEAPQSKLKRSTAAYMLFLFCLLASTVATAQTTEVKKMDFSSPDGVSYSLDAGTGNVSNGVLSVTGRAYDFFLVWGRQYSGYVNVNPSLTLQPGYEYQVSVRARMGGASGKLEINRGTSAANARSATGTNVILTSSGDNVNSSDYATFTSNKFSVTSSQSLFLALLVDRTTIWSNTEISLVLDDLIVTQTCISPPTPTAADVIACRTGNSRVTLTASGATTGYGYRWYNQPTGGAVIATTARYQTPSLSPGEYRYYVSIVNTATGCESNRVLVKAITGSAAPIVSNTSVCPMGSATLTASGAPAGSTYKWYDTNGNNAIAVATGATYTTGPLTGSKKDYWVSTVNQNNCESSKSKVTVTVVATPVVQITNPAAVCSPATVNLTAAAIKTGSTNVSAYTYFTDAAATTALADPGAVATSGTYYIKGTNSAGCSDIKPVTVVVNPTTALSDIKIPDDIEIGKPATIVLNSEIIDRGHAASFTWYMSIDGGEFVQQAGSTSELSLARVPKGSLQFRCDMTQMSGSCYDATYLQVRSTP
ncbi:immunoglobulin domain-containing protein, partial [Pontibacter actiniarum]